ncbi:hypothetical protein K1X80_09825 [Pseudomonas sp. So3.2b]|uniref:hypothetical protein n=1 Tax=Pseudomonas sp. So3.2b TaxID=2864101 RepID=UPI001C68EDFA|nr:hypothetical protein [Pseudomonas sp. So3.2b]QYM70610.1 hypothetical protein K1X80_09825 [Pseudomonas sp. So3.2b]
MTNQTIDGVPRHTLRLALAGIEYLALRADDIGTSSVQLAAELRTLLDAPPRCPDCGYTEQDCREQMDHYLCGLPEPAPANNPAAQPQGEQSAYDPAKENKQFEAWARTQSQVDLRLCDIGLYYERETGLAHDAWQHRAKLAEQPAPVAVASRDESIYWLKRIDGIGQARAELIYSMGFRRHTEVPKS